MSQQVNFTNHVGENLAATLHLPDDGPAGGVVLGHCFTCSRHTGILREISQGLAHRGFMALRFDFSGNGQSEGDFFHTSYSKYIREVERAVDFLRRRGARWIGLAGHSMGAAVAMLSAARVPDIRAVCAIAGRLNGLTPMHFLNADQKADLELRGEVTFNSRGRDLRLSRDFFSDAGSYDLPEAIANLDVPALVVHGTRDEIIPATEADTAYRINSEMLELDIVQGADHMFSDAEQRRAIAGRIAHWFSRQRVADTLSRNDHQTSIANSKALSHENT